MMSSGTRPSRTTTLLRPLLVLTALAALASGATVRITSPDSESSYHAGDAVPVKWFSEGTGESFQILLLKAGEQVADLCEAEKDGVCFDLTQDQTVLLPSSGLESGSDYTVSVKDTTSDAEAVSEPFTVIGDANSNLEITSPDGATALSAGQEVQVEWLYVGNNTLFDIYVRQGEEESSARVSENLCAGELGGSCTGANVGSATVTIPAELEEGTNYSLLVVDKKDDDAYGMSRSLSIGVSVASAGSGSRTSTAANIGIVIGSCVGGICFLALFMALLRRRNREQRRQEKLATLDMLNKRRPAPSVSLAVEDMQEPCTPKSDDPQDPQKNFINPIYSTSQSFYEGQITPPTEDSTLWRRSRDMGRFVGKQINRSFSRSRSFMND